MNIGTIFSSPLLLLLFCLFLPFSVHSFWFGSPYLASVKDYNIYNEKCFFCSHCQHSLQSNGNTTLTLQSAEYSLRWKCRKQIISHAQIYTLTPYTNVMCHFKLSLPLICRYFNVWEITLALPLTFIRAFDMCARICSSSHLITFIWFFQMIMFFIYGCEHKTKEDY